MTIFCIKCDDPIRDPQLEGEDEICCCCSIEPGDELDEIKQEAYVEGWQVGSAEAYSAGFQGGQEAAHQAETGFIGPLEWFAVPGGRIYQTVRGICFAPYAEPAMRIRTGGPGKNTLVIPE